jgi:aspartate/methionine/tyrosine aminotransferase
VSTPVQCAAARLLQVGDDIRRQIRERCAENLASAREALAGSAGNILAVEGGWYITIQVPKTRTEEEWTLELLEREDVLVQPGYFYDFETEPFLIVSLLTAPPVFNEGLARLRAFL